jgi:predicted naringenin-chalcone synthase
MDTYLHSFRPVLAPWRNPQNRLIHWLAAAHARAEKIQNSERTSSGSSETDREQFFENLIRRYSGSQSETKAPIQFRASFLEDFKSDFSNQEGIYHLTTQNQGRGAGLSDRMALYDHVTTGLMNRIYPFDATLPAQLIHVTCTGYIAPSAPQKFLGTRESSSTGVTHAYHMGCYAAIPAIRIAQGLVSEDARGVDVVHTELCTLHLDPSNHTPEQLVIQSLFADGAIAYRVSRRPEGMQIHRIFEVILPGTQDLMTWIPGPQGFEMTLSQEIPRRLTVLLPELISRWIKESGLPIAVQDCIFAVHPGGPRIIEEVQRCLHLSDDQVRASKWVLAEHGNMSSATLPTIWNVLNNDLLLPPGQPIISLAFGPGLTIFGMISTLVGSEEHR